jgi:biotin-(acetyl-CoA carboxylase) ligase
MPLETRTALAPELTLPPPYTAVRLRELGDAFAHAIEIAPKHGAGTLVHVGRFDLAEFALVLEPEEPLRQARRAFYAGMAAMADALAATAPPETAINIEWPDALYVNWGLVGGGRLAWPKKIGEDEVLPWMVFGGMIRTASMAGNDPGATPDITALDEEGFADITANHVVESFARNFMHTIDTWHDSGFGAVAKSYLERFPAEQGLRRDIDDNGDLLLRRTASSGKVERNALLPRLKEPSWFDPVSKGPRA